ncbi:DUF6526 family protein [Geothrix sp. 21YS21S-4]|uniref:DUF6526 family protein n=1 Tax=Geothrix sp. 21YS21S-4 TaxID=3068889 RepID=UPI0027BAC788|nr:DUF6526 family protein [Geothrix sp. 21YS21S-4]
MAQTYATHKRLDPFHHFFLVPVFLITFIAAAWHAVRYPSLHSIWMGIAALALLGLAAQVRLYALKVQDRLIRLEEILRLQRLLPADLQARIPELTVKQLVALRFASDTELPDRTREALDQHLDNPAIKRRIQSWRGDEFRI